MNICKVYCYCWEEEQNLPIKKEKDMDSNQTKLRKVLNHIMETFHVDAQKKEKKKAQQLNECNDNYGHISASDRHMEGGHRTLQINIITLFLISSKSIASNALLFLFIVSI